MKRISSESDLVKFEDVLALLNNMDEKIVVSFEGIYGTSTSVVGKPYQTIELKIVYSETEEENSEDGEKKD